MTVTSDDPQASALSAKAAAFYRHAIGVLKKNDIRFMVGGAYAFSRYTGIVRDTKDCDVFLHPDEAPQARSALRKAGYEVEVSFPHWLSKVRSEQYFVDLIHGSGNGLTPVDDEWFEHSPEAEVLGQSVHLVPAEEMIWSKAFIMERERFDGADVAHLLEARGQDLDWPRLLRRFDEHWRVLLSHLVLFAYIYPTASAKMPAAVMETLMARLSSELDQTVVERPGALCRGTNLSRAQYLHDLQSRGFRDARLRPWGSMSEADVALWTAAIDEDEHDPPVISTGGGDPRDP